MHKPNPTFNIFYQFDCIQQPPSQGQKAKDHQRRRPTNSCHVLNSLAQRRHLTPVIGLQPIKTINVLHFGCQRITFHVAFVVDLDLALVIVFIEDGCFQHCLMIDAFRCHLALKTQEQFRFLPRSPSKREEFGSVVQRRRLYVLSPNVSTTLVRYLRRNLRRLSAIWTQDAKPALDRHQVSCRLAQCALIWEKCNLGKTKLFAFFS